MLWTIVNPGGDDVPKALALGKQQSWLDALPLFEDLFKKNPNDALVLEGLGQSLIAHSATLQDPDAAGLQLLLRLYHEQLIEPYVLLNGADQGIAQDYEAYRAKNRAKLEAYLGEFVAPEPTPAPH